MSDTPATPGPRRSILAVHLADARAARAPREARYEPGRPFRGRRCVDCGAVADGEAGPVPEWYAAGSPAALERQRAGVRDGTQPRRSLCAECMADLAGRA